MKQKGAKKCLSNILKLVHGKFYKGQTRIGCSCWEQQHDEINKGTLPKNASFQLSSQGNEVTMRSMVGMHTVFQVILLDHI